MGADEFDIPNIPRRGSSNLIALRANSNFLDNAPKSIISLALPDRIKKDSKINPPNFGGHLNEEEDSKSEVDSLVQYDNEELPNESQRKNSRELVEHDE
jgi:hypothetical protein